MSFLPSADREYFESKGIAFEEIQDGKLKGVILRKRTLPDGKFDATEVDVLVLLPPGYPDVPPDMFYIFPWIKLLSNNRYPKAADRPLKFGHENWQRWSRHNSEWRPGVDGIWTMLKRIEHAIKEAT